MNTTIYRTKSLLLLGLLFFSSLTFAQSVAWNDAHPETVVFELTNKDALKLIKGKFRQKHWDKILQSPFTRFTDTWTDRPAKGHFLFANVEQNKVNYRYSPVIPFHVFLFKEYGVLTLQVVDSQGVIRNDAKVRVGGNAVYYNKDSQTYTDDNWSKKEQHILTVELDKFRAIFDLTKHLVEPWRKDNGKQDTPEFYSYLITDKNKYKPGETVRFKSYGLSEHKRPLKKNLDLWMHTGGGRQFKKIMSVVPYHPGGFAGEFQLADSLRLALDKIYTIQLRDERGRIVASTGLSYEDYELNGNKLLVELNAPIQYSPRKNGVEIRAMDVNGLPLRDTNVEVIVGRHQVLQSYTDVLTLPDTLISIKVELDASGKATVDIPSEIFGASDCFYNVDVVLLTTDNQRLEQRRQATFYYSSYNIACVTRADSLHFSLFDLGVERSSEAELSYGDKKESKKVRLPYWEPFNQNVSGYRFRIPEIGYDTYIPSTDLEERLELKGGVEKDSLLITLSNPLKLELSWCVYKGNNLLLKGSGKEMECKLGGVDASSVYYVEIFYFMGDKECVLRRSYTSPSERLLIESDLPQRAYPGQKVRTTLNVSDALGRPASNVDITAFAVNNQLGHLVPDLPYYGPAPLPREQRASYSMNEKNYVYSSDLDYEYWSRALELDCLPYYQFAYPLGKLFRQTIDTPNGTTEFAPYVMKNGEAVNIYVIEQDDAPCYFSWTEQPGEYSFRVRNPLGKQKLTLRMSDRAFVIDSVAFDRGKKTIMSFDMDRLPEGVRVVWLNHKQDGKYIFTDEERKRYEQYICRMPVNSKEDFCLLTRFGDLFPVSIRELSPFKKTMLVGPVLPGRWRYMNGVEYRHEGGYSYGFEGNVVYKYKDNDLFPRFLRYSSSAKISTLNDFCLTPTRFYKLIAELMDRKKWHPSQIYLSQPDRQLLLRLPAEKDSTGVANLLLRNRANGQMMVPNMWINKNNVYPDFSAGMYDVIVLYNNGKYLRRDSLPVRPFTYLDVNMERLLPYAEDSLSARWLELDKYDGAIGDNHPNRREWRVTQPKRRYGDNAYGYVYDSSGEPLVGCYVLIKGTREGTITDLNGYFKLNCDKAGESVQFTYIGFNSVELKVTPGMEVSVTMEESYQMLEEAVVVGYGTRKTNLLAGSLAGVMTSRSSGTTAPLEKLEDPDEEDNTEPDIGQLYNELAQLNGLRRNFSDIAFWQPRLYTDKKGEATFEVTFPDNITKWDAVVYGMNRHLQTGTFRRSIRSYKPLMAELRTPRFLVTGDESNLTGAVRNYMEGQRIMGKTEFTIGKETPIQRVVNLTEGFHETLSIRAADTDSVTMGYLFTRDDGYKDGEEYTIPVLPQGTEMAQGSLGILSNGQSVKVKAGAKEEVWISVTDNPIDIYKESVNDLIRYKYLCNEQLASKLIGLLAHQQYKRYQGEKVNMDKDVKMIIRRLMNNRNHGQKLWSWWGSAGNTSYWMSAHILRALKMAKDAGYEVELEMDKLEVNYADTRPYRGMKMEDIDILHALSGWGVRADYASAVRLLEPLVRGREQREDSLARKDKSYRPFSFLKEKLLLWEIRQQRDSVNMSDSVRRYLKKDILGGVYCDDGKRTNYWEGNKLINTLIAYRIIKSDPFSADLQEAMKLYILRTKERGWNTYEASSAVATVLTDLLASPNGRTGTNVSVSGKENAIVSSFPYQAHLLEGDSLTLTKTGDEPLLYSAYTMRRTMNECESEAFKVETALEKDTLLAGVPINLKVILRVKREGARYVMLEVPVPAGCSYASKPMSYIGKETHREYFKEKTVIFSENLPVGTYEFSIPLLPRFTGSYTLNPAKVELMYFPVVNANNEGKRIRIAPQSRITNY